MRYPTPQEIAMLKERGFDPAFIAKAEAQALLEPRTLELCQLIEAAFAGVTLGNGTGLMEAQGLDDYADAATLATYRVGDEKEDWRRISAEALNRCNSSLSFFDAEGMRFHLPAYLIADLRGEYGFLMTFCLTHLSDYCIRQFALLSDAQRSAVRAFLLHALNDIDCELEEPDIRRALAEYWTEPAAA